MSIAITEAFTTIAEVERQFQLSRTENPDFFPEWQEPLRILSGGVVEFGSFEGLVLSFEWRSDGVMEVGCLRGMACGTLETRRVSIGEVLRWVRGHRGDTPFGVVLCQVVRCGNLPSIQDLICLHDDEE